MTREIEAGRGQWRGVRALVLAGAVAAALLAVAPPAMAQWSAATLPGDGNISGVAGSRIGWGYEIENQEQVNWLVLTAIGADAVQHAFTEALFDLPIVAPGAQSTLAFAGFDGLYALTWDADAPVGFVNIGSFVLSAEWWDGDPLAGGLMVASAPDIVLHYSATVTQVPESSPQAMLLLGLVVLMLRRRFTSA